LPAALYSSFFFRIWLKYWWTDEGERCVCECVQLPFRRSHYRCSRFLSKNQVKAGVRGWRRTKKRRERGEEEEEEEAGAKCGYSEPVRRGLSKEQKLA
jgi:hypothetical protein